MRSAKRHTAQMQKQKNLSIYDDYRSQKGGNMTEKRKRGRPMSSHDVSVTPEFREMPDIEKLGRVLISIAINNAKNEEQDKAMDGLLGGFYTERGM